MYIIFKDDKGAFRIQSMSGKGFDSRAPLSEPWRGLRTDDIAKISGMADVVFVHHSGFIGGALTMETCIKMAEISLEELKNKKLEKK
jgi:uncharacterized UPF0160 family protein